MKASELRIGNYIFDKDSLRIESVLNISGFNKVNMDHWAPIPLTEEWLLKFGFRYSEPLKMHILYNNPATCEPDDYEDSVYHNVGFFYNGECFGFEVSNEWGENGNLMMSKIKYVHQLQNLYYALTGQEIEIK